MLGAAAAIDAWYGQLKIICRQLPIYRQPYSFFWIRPNSFLALPFGMKISLYHPSSLFLKMACPRDMPMLSPQKYQCFLVLLHPFSHLKMRREIRKSTWLNLMYWRKMIKVELNTIFNFKIFNWMSMILKCQQMTVALLMSIVIVITGKELFQTSCVDSLAFVGCFFFGIRSFKGLPLFLFWYILHLAPNLNL